VPRPYGWIKGEGTTKAQRWGLEGLGSSTLVFNDIPTTNYWDWATGGNANSNATSMMDAAGNNLLNIGSGTGANTVGGWLQNNMGLVVVGLGLVLLLRRR
jgi:hypothetical protein